jgi:phospholipase C
MGSSRKLTLASLLVSAALALSGCGAAASQSTAIPSLGGRFANHSGGSTPIQHIIIVMQENRSFNNLFYGFPGAKTAKFGKGHGAQYPLQKVDLKFTKLDLNHSHTQFLEDYDQGKDDGWDDLIENLNGPGPICKDPINKANEPSCWVYWKNKAFRQAALSYVDPTQIVPYWTMAKQYALGDNTFSSNNGPTFVSHQYLVAGESGHSVEVPDGVPWGCEAKNHYITVNLLAYGQASPPAYSPATGHEIAGPFPCFTYPTIASALDGAGLTWRYYAQKADSGRDLEPFQANKPIWNGPDRANIISPDTAVLTDIANGNLANVSWVTPSGLKSDHPGPQSGNLGPSWVASIVNAVGQSQYWDSTAVIIMWDEWGGWFDPVHPPQYPDPQTGAREGLGFRVPLIVVSPYAKAGYISHDQHEIASTLTFIEETFGLPKIGGGDCKVKATMYADCRADGFDDMFDYTQSPIPFVVIPTTDAHYFLTHVDNTPGDTY